jgi:hypothetical protein
MPAPLIALMILWLSIGCVFTSRCRFATASKGWRGQLAQLLATLILIVIWPVLAWSRVLTLLS